MRKVVTLTEQVVRELDALRAKHGTSYDGAVRLLLEMEQLKTGRPRKWPFDHMAVGETVGFDAPAGVEFKDREAMRTAVWRAEQGTGKRFNISPTREAGQVRVTRVA